MKSKIQQLKELAAQAEIICRDGLEMVMHGRLEGEKRHELAAKLNFLGGLAVEALKTESYPDLGNAPLYRVGDLLHHKGTGTAYGVLQTPDDGVRIEGTNEPAYAYAMRAKDRITWVRAQSEMEDGRFEVVRRRGQDLAPPAAALGLLPAAPPVPAGNKFPIQVESRCQEANGWVEAGMYHNAMFDHPQPAGIKGCPAGRSQLSVADAIRDLVIRTNGESGTALSADSLEVSRYTIGQACWRPEHSSGRHGWRCQTCNGWVPNGNPFDCACLEPTPTP
jgi:hypothetical protein